MTLWVNMNLIKTLSISALLLFVAHVQVLGDNSYSSIDTSMEFEEETFTHESAWSYLMEVLASITRAIEAAKNAGNDDTTQRYIDNTSDLF